MSSRHPRRLAAVLFALLMALPLVASPVSAAASPCPPGQPPDRPPGTPPGQSGNTPVGQPVNRPNKYTTQGECQLQLNQSSASRGEQVRLAGAGYAPNSSVQLTLNSDPMSLGSVTTNGSGAFTHTVTVPAAAPIGSHTITAAGVDPSNNAFVLSAAFEVTAAGAPGVAGSLGETSGNLPRTGTSTIAMVMASVALMAVGIVLVGTARRRRLQPTA